MFRTTFTGVDEELKQLFDEVSAELVPLVERAAQDISLRAAGVHPYTDRTGNLTRSIEPLPAVKASDGVVRGGVVAGEEYASYLEEGGYAFIEPAARDAEPAIEGDAARSVTNAVTRAGWKAQ